MQSLTCFKSWIEIEGCWVALVSISKSKQKDEKVADQCTDANHAGHSYHPLLSASTIFWTINTFVVFFLCSSLSYCCEIGELETYCCQWASSPLSSFCHLVEYFPKFAAPFQPPFRYRPFFVFPLFLRSAPPLLSFDSLFTSCLILQRFHYTAKVFWVHFHSFCFPSLCLLHHRVQFAQFRITICKPLDADCILGFPADKEDQLQLIDIFIFCLTLKGSRTLIWFLFLFSFAFERTSGDLFSWFLSLYLFFCFSSLSCIFFAFSRST